MSGNEAERGMRGWLADMAAAMALLTILPVPMRWQTGAAWPRALRVLPLVGALVGVVSAAALALALEAGLPANAAALLALLAGAIVTGALHEDGLADTADALGGHTRERRLEIMRDARAGSFAILALLFATGLQAAALMTLAGRGAMFVLAALVAAHALSRFAIVIMVRRLPPARDDGMGHGVARPDMETFGQAGVAALLPAFAVLMPFSGFHAAPAAVFMALVAAAGMEWLARKYFGGQTGDVLGATEVMARTAALLALAA